MDVIKELFSKLWEEFDWFIIGLFAVAVIWFFGGGYNNESAHNGAYIKPAAPLDSGETYGTYYAGTPTTKKETLNLPESPAEIIRKTEDAVQSFLNKMKTSAPIAITSSLAESILFDGVAGAKQNDIKTEYIRIIANTKNSNSVKISGLGLQGAYFDGTIYIPKSGTNDIYLGAGDRAIIETGVSPTGSSFLVNSCSSYMNGASKLNPALHQSNFTGSMTYDECTATHRNDSNFNSNEWRIFLNQKFEIWGNSGDSIRLLDGKGKVIDVLQY